MEYITLVDTPIWDKLLPLTYTRSVADIRIGVYTIREKWNKYSGASISIDARSYMQSKYGKSEEADIKINSAILPNTDLVNEIFNLEKGQSLFKKSLWIASHGTGKYDKIQLPLSIKCSVIEYPEHLFIYAGQEIINDLNLIRKNNKTETLSSSNTVIGDHEIFIEKGAIIECAILNTTDGPIYLGRNAEVMEGTMIRGPFCLGNSSVIKMGSRIYGNTCIGPGCKIGGEVKNSVILGHSNKAHDGYMGNSVIGEWCNWGADTNNSNMKNNYKEVKLWDYTKNEFRSTGQQFVGLIMGDHSKTSINTMFNTGTVVGVSCNTFGSGFPRKFIPSFTWGGALGYNTYQLEKALDTANEMQKRRNQNLSETEANILRHIYDTSGQYRMWEK